MKHLFIPLLFLSFFAHSQSESWEYCVARYQEGGVNSKCIFYVDYGTKAFSDQKMDKALDDAGKQDVLRDSTRNAQINSPAAGFNLLGQEGWEMVSSYAKVDFTLKEQVFFVFKRRKR